MTDNIIEDTIDIDATAERVWELISEPGWWINGGTYREHVIDEQDGVTYVTDSEHGTFPIILDRAEPPRYIAYRWLMRESDPTGPGTLTEMWIDGRDGGVTLRVRESGFETLGLGEVELRSQIDGNREGWKTELAVAKTWSEA
ncbi:SRPBCC domain-containing protein [Aeromicrobium sp. P5_D10]